MSVQYPFKNLVFEGGGVKGIAYIGAIEILGAAGILDQIEKVAGASAGAATALMVSFKLPIAETLRIINTLDYSKVPGSAASTNNPLVPDFLEKYTDELKDDMGGILRLINNYGWHSSSYLYSWLQETIAGQCEGNGRATFADFQQRGFRDLHVVTTNVSQQKPVIFCAKDTPNVAVADAVRMSMSIPLYFESMAFDGQNFGSGDQYADGGTILNYPIDLFDEGHVNWATLGCCLYTPDYCPTGRKPVTNLLTYIENLVEVMLNTQVIDFAADSSDLRRSIQISNECVSATDFSIKPGDPTYHKLVTSGAQATHNFLENYKKHHP